MKKSNNEGMSKEPTPTPSFANEKLALDLVALPNGDVRFIRYHDGTQTVLTDFAVTVDGKTYCPCIDYIRKRKVILPDGPGKKCDPSDLLNRIKKVFRSAIKINSSEDLCFMCIYCFATWNFTSYDYVNYAAIIGPPGVGKSQVLRVFSELCYNTMIGSGQDTESSMVRGIDTIQSTLALDEVQKSTDSNTSSFHRILTLGNYRTGVVNMSVPTGNNSHYETRSFSVFGPKVMSGRLIPSDEAVISRIYEIKMPYLKRSEIQVTQLDDKELMKEMASLRNDLLLYRQQRRIGELSSPGDNFISILEGIDPSGREYQVNEWLIKECTSKEAAQILSNAILKQRKRAVELRSLSLEYEVFAATYKLVLDRPMEFPMLKDIAKAMRVP